MSSSSASSIHSLSVPGVSYMFAAWLAGSGDSVSLEGVAAILISTNALWFDDDLLSFKVSQSYLRIPGSYTGGSRMWGLTGLYISTQAKPIVSYGYPRLHKDLIDENL